MLLGVALASLNTSSKPFFNFPQAGELQSHKINCHRSWGRTVRGIKPGSRLESNKYLLPFLSARCGNRCKMKFSDLWEASQTQLCCCCKQAESQEWLLVTLLGVQNLSVHPGPPNLWHPCSTPCSSPSQAHVLRDSHTDKCPSEALGHGCLVLKYCKDTGAVAALSGSQNFNFLFSKVQTSAPLLMWWEPLLVPSLSILKEACYVLSDLFQHNCMLRKLFVLLSHCQKHANTTKSHTEKTTTAFCLLAFIFFPRKGKATAIYREVPKDQMMSQSLHIIVPKSNLSHVQ